MTPLDAMLQRLHEESELRTMKVRMLLIGAGKFDDLAEFDQRMKEIDNGVDRAKACWHSISSAQRFVLRAMGDGRYLTRSLRSKAQFDALGRAPAILNICRLATARKLCAHELIHVNGGATDPEAQFVITERGRFVLRHGQAND